MARNQKLKVFRTPTGFHDAYVAAPSQKAALAAWGSDADLFARGIAELVTDEALAREPLENPGKVIKRLRGTKEEQLAALAVDPPRQVSDDEAAEASEPPRKPKPKSRPSRLKLAAAEQMLSASDSFANALNAISQLSPDQRRSTLDNLGGESIADISTSVALVGNRFNELLRQRLAVGGAGNSADPSLIAGITGGKRGLDQVRASGQVGAEGSSFADGSRDSHAGAWVQTFGGAGRLDGLGGAASIRDQSYGVAAGIDAKVAGLSIGGAFAASALDTRVAGRSATNTGTLYQGGGYVAYDDGTAYASAVGSYFSGDVTSSRQVYVGAAFQGTATGTPRVTGYTAGGAAGYRLPVGGGVRFTPQVSFQATHVDRAAFTETGAGVLSLGAAKDVRTLYTATAEGRLSYLSAAPGGIVEPYVGAGAAFAFGDLNTVSANQFTGAPTGTGAFSITGARLSPTTALINGGIEAHPNDRVTLGMGVEGRLSNRQRDGRVELHVRLGF